MPEALPDDALTHLVEHRCDFRIRGWGLVQKTGLQALGGPIHKDPLKKQHVDVEV